MSQPAGVHDAVELRTSRAATGRNVAVLVSRLWRMRVSGGHYLPAEGPVLLVSNHSALLDGLFLSAAAYRPAHVLVLSLIHI